MTMENGVVTQTNSTDIPRFYLSGEIDYELCKEFISFHTNSVKHGVTEALLYIDSPGGAATSLSTIINILQNGEILYHTIALGNACSAACMLTAFGHFRWAVPETVFLFHDASFITGGNIRQMEESIETQKIFLGKLLEQFAAHTNRKVDFWLEMAYSKVNGDYYFDAEKALEFGVIDFIGMPTITRQSQFIVELPVEMEEFEELMLKRGVQSEHLTTNHTSSQKKKVAKKSPTKKKPAKKNTK